MSTFLMIEKYKIREDKDHKNIFFRRQIDFFHQNPFF